MSKYEREYEALGALSRRKIVFLLEEWLDKTYPMNNFRAAGQKSAINMSKVLALMALNEEEIDRVVENYRREGRPLLNSPLKPTHIAIMEGGIYLLIRLEQVAEKHED